MVRVEQTVFNSRYLCSAHSFLLITKGSGKIFVWHGIGSFLFERLAATIAAEKYFKVINLIHYIIFL